MALEEHDPANLVDPEARRLSFGERAVEYDRFRPSYPRDAVTWALGAAPRRVVDLGAGTGLMSEVLLDCGHDVVAVEPDQGMRDQLAARFGGRIRALDGSAEAIPVDDGSCDAVVVAQAFHWFELDTALPEIARVLRPGGALVIVWNVRDDDVQWVEQLSRIVGRVDARSGNRDEGVPRIEPWFESAERGDFSYLQRLDDESLERLVDTYSYVALSPARAEILQQVRDLVARHPALAGRASFDLPYVTTVYRATKS
jgi:SAM-dependent methyltransferase